MSTTYIHLANLLTCGCKDTRDYCLSVVRAGKATTLETFWKEKELRQLLDANPDIKIFLDSGAHSLLNAQAGLIHSGGGISSEKKGNESTITHTEEEFDDRLSTNQKIFFGSRQATSSQMFVDSSFNQNDDVRRYLDRYIEFIHKYKNQLLGYVNLDIIYNAEQSWKNQQYMEENGLRPIPVFHYGEDFIWLHKYIKEYDYIGIGGVAGGITLKQFVQSLGDKAFECIAKERPGLKVHGFAVTSVKLMQRFPWESCDSTTWLKHAAYGNVMVPKTHPITGKFDYSKSPLTVSVSEVTLVKECGHAHYTLALSNSERDRVDAFFAEAGVDPIKLQTSALERSKVNIYYFQQVLKDDSIRVKKDFKKKMVSFF